MPADRAVDQLRGLCDRAVATLPASGAALSVAGEAQQYTLLAAADPVSERLGELQYVLGEGPAVDAADGHRPVFVPELDREPPARWPMYAPAARLAGVRAVFAFPLQVGAARLGVLDVFRTSPGALSGVELTLAFALADDAVAILLGGGEPDTAGLAGAPELFQAQGMVMIQIDGTLAEAMARIRAYAFAENRRLIDVAREIVARNLLFERDG